MQKLDKILEEIDREKKNVALSTKHTTAYVLAQIRMAERIEEIIRKHINDDWISVERGLPENGSEVWVILKPTYESDYREYSVARYLHFENGEGHWCDNHYGYLEWDKYSDGHGGSSWYRVVAWQKIDPYRPERSKRE